MTLGVLAVVHASHPFYANGTFWAAAAVIIDSIVTIGVGWRLNKTARQETANALEQVKPALQEELGKAAVMLIPLLADLIKKHLAEKEAEKSETTGAIQAIGNKSAADNRRVG